jgi:DNA gyrase subunit A
MPEESTWVTLTVAGKLSRTRDTTRPGVTADMKEPPRFVVESSTTDILYLFTANGQCATIPVQQFPPVEDYTQGFPLTSMCGLTEEDEVTAVFSLPPSLETGYLFMATEGAEVKRLRLEDLPGMSSKVFSIMDVEKDGEDQILLTTAQGQAIRFEETDVRPTGLSAGGMRGIKLANEGDRVVGADIAVEGEYVWTITDDGVAKISPLSDYPTQGRAGSGVIAMRLPKTSAEVAAATVGRQDENIVVLTDKQKALYMRMNRAPQVARGRAGGDFVISLRPKERVATVVNYQERVATPDPSAMNGDLKGAE